MASDVQSQDILSLPAVPSTVPADGIRQDEPLGMTGTLPQTDRLARLVQAKFRGVRVGTFGFVLEPAALYEIVESTRISPLPGVTSLCKGLVNHRSNVVPVYDITELAGAKPQHWERKRLLILDTKERAVGIILYGLPAQITVDTPVQANEIIDVPEIFYRHTSGGYWSNDTIWLSLNRESFFTELNTLCLMAA